MLMPRTHATVSAISCAGSVSDSNHPTGQSRTGRSRPTCRFCEAALRIPHLPLWRHHSTGGEAQERWQRGPAPRPAPAGLGRWYQHSHDALPGTFRPPEVHRSDQLVIGPIRRAHLLSLIGSANKGADTVPERPGASTARRRRPFLYRELLSIGFQFDQNGQVGQWRSTLGDRALSIV